jgi:peptidyl-prolyl cis-trans isomerase A (cyclophilin A)
MTRARMETEKGTIVVELFDDDAPETVKNFAGLAAGTKEWIDPKTGARVKRPYYDGLRFHRVIPGFVAQSGDPTTAYDELRAHWGSGGPGYSIRDEVHGARQTHVRGRLSMAHRGPNTGGSQFFLCRSALEQLDRKHTVFGEVVEGMDVVDRLDEGDRLVRVAIEAD